MNKSRYEINAYTESFHAFGVFTYSFDACKWILTDVSLVSGEVKDGESMEDALFDQFDNEIEIMINRSEYL